MANESEKIELLKEHGIQQLIPYIYKLEEYYYCLDHLGLKHQNLGNIKKHVRGHYHRTEWETNKPYKKPKSVEKNQNNTESQNLESIRSEMESFNATREKLRVIFELQDEPQGYLLTKYELKGDMRDDVLKYLELRLRLRIIENYYQNGKTMAN